MSPSLEKRRSKLRGGTENPSLYASILKNGLTIGMHNSKKWFGKKNPELNRSPSVKEIEAATKLIKGFQQFYAQKALTRAIGENPSKLIANAEHNLLHSAEFEESFKPIFFGDEENKFEFRVAPSAHPETLVSLQLRYAPIDWLIAEYGVNFVELNGKKAVVIDLVQGEKHVSKEQHNQFARAVQNATGIKGEVGWRNVLGWLLLHHLEKDSHLVMGIKSYAQENVRHAEKKAAAEKNYDDNFKKHGFEEIKRNNGIVGGFRETHVVKRKPFLADGARQLVEKLLEHRVKE